MLTLVHVRSPLTIACLPHFFLAFGGAQEYKQKQATKKAKKEAAKKNASSSGSAAQKPK
jgi:hypothetical protein